MYMYFATLSKYKEQAFLCLKPRSPQMAPAVEEKDDELVLQDCLEPFKGKDYIMDPEIFGSVKRYFFYIGVKEERVE